MAAIALIAAVAFGVPAVKHQSWREIMTGSNGESSLSTSSGSSDNAGNATPEQESSPSTTITAKRQLADYSWDELSRISTQISNASSDSEALDIAERFNLTDASGKLSSAQTKDVQLTDGTSIPVRIAGFRQDVASDGSLAGITFIASTSLTTRSMNSSKNSNGGWQQSNMRSWLNDNLLDQFDSDVRNHIVTARKPSNGVGVTDDPRSVTTSEDKIWLPSLTEIGGTIPRSDYEQGSEYVADVFNAEGAAKDGPQYQLFSNLGVNQSDPSGVLRPSNNHGWWLRSASPRRDGRFMTIRSDGTPGYGADADDDGNVMIGFCL
ncbi:DUF6273 domain-containing protein [Bifidobacterium pluvialisilvae]|uniref:DUF6273 domain-containing protein n=1 Tax=Bifidobacterium pluvialisilvae TaxID=2834436 RepID=UPI0027E3B15A|nr:DUF6273 domain-containing protein [Bifidobacterium pluvialisilvae]